MTNKGLSLFPRPAAGRMRCGATAPRRAEHGTALAVSLMLLLVLTLLGATSLEGTALQQKMATNQLVTQQALEAAEGGATRMYRDETFILDSGDQLVNSGVLGSAPADAEQGVNESGYEAEGGQTSESAAGRGKGQNIMESSCRKFHFELVSVGTTDNTHAKVTVHQGAYRFICGSDGGLRQTATTLGSSGG